MCGVMSSGVKYPWLWFGVDIVPVYDDGRFCIRLRFYRSRVRLEIASQ
jgi:hypothetical protein